jgi:Arc/MetJ-type ribon-helix-helix transcriptional regulator
MALPKRPGRPPNDPSGPSSAICVRVPDADYERIERVAKLHRTSVSDVIRRSLKHLLRDERGG